MPTPSRPRSRLNPPTDGSQEPENGVNLIYIRDLLGHADVSTTEIHARADAETKRKAIENAYQPLTPDSLPDWTSDSFAGLLPNVIAGRIANRFDLGGTATTPRPKIS